MIYIKGINPSTGNVVYFRGYLGIRCNLWTENFNQKLNLQNIENAQNTLNYLIGLNISISNLEIITS